jgi:hypothetical protein
MGNIYPKYNFNTYIKIHPKIPLGVRLMGHISLFMDENKLKNHPTHRFKLSIVETMTKIVEISFYNCKYS